MTYSFDLQIRMVNHYNNSNKSLRTIAEEFNLSKSSLHRWINDISVIKTEKKNIYKKRLEILTFLKRSLGHNPFQNLKMLNNKINKKFDIDITTKTISNYMKIIGYTKKKIVRRLYNKSLKDHLLKRKIIKDKIKTLNFEDIVCLDECGINRKLHADRGWCHSNMRLEMHIKTKDLLTNNSLLMAITKDGVLKYSLYKNQAVNTKILCAFLTDLLKNIKNKYILMDNVSFHKSQLVAEIIKNSGNEILFIPPYSPDFNPIEEVFSKLKSYLKTHITPITMNKDIHKLLKKFSKLPCTYDGYYKHAFN